MNRIIKKVLNEVEKKGFEAYLVGGYVRDLLLGRLSYDIDICTNATPKELITIFPFASLKNLGGIDFKIKEYHFEITTYREEIKYSNRRPIEFNYINNLVIDLKRRDFTINAICMNIKGNILDLEHGLDDLTNGKIVAIGDVDKKFKEDPLRMLRGIRFATILNFKLDTSIINGIKKHYKKIATLSKTRIKEELDKILLSNNVKKGLELLNMFGILSLLEISYNDIVPTSSILGMYAQIDIKGNFAFKKEEKNSINNIKEIIKYGDITKNIVYKYGLYLSLVAGEILGINKEKVNKIYKELPIHERKDINIKASDIVTTLKIKNAKISIVMKDLEELIINGVIKNKKSDILKYLNLNKVRWI